MKLNIRALMISVATVTAILATLCVLVIAIAPTATMNTFGYLTHIDVSSIQRPLTFASGVLGIIAWTLASVIVAAMVGAFYNRSVATGAATRAETPGNAYRQAGAVR